MILTPVGAVPVFERLCAGAATESLAYVAGSPVTKIDYAHWAEDQAYRELVQGDIELAVKAHTGAAA